MGAQGGGAKETTPIEDGNLTPRRSLGLKDVIFLMVVHPHWRSKWGRPERQGDNASLGYKFPTRSLGFRTNVFSCGSPYILAFRGGGAAQDRPPEPWQMSP